MMDSHLEDIHLSAPHPSVYQFGLSKGLLSLKKSAENCGNIGGIELMNHGRGILPRCSDQPLDPVSIDSVLKAGDTV